MLLQHLGLTAVADLGDALVAWLVRYWWIAVPLALLIALEGAIFVAQLFAHHTLRRLARSVPVTRYTLVEGDGFGEPRPASGPAASRELSVSRAAHPSVDALSLVVPVHPSRPSSDRTVRARQRWLASWAAAVRPAAPCCRPGGVGLGLSRGTAMVFQHPESQVLGMRVRDDVVWGLEASDEVDVGSVLARVGLAGFEDRDTSTLSGGELQRLAVAAALARADRRC